MWQSAKGEEKNELKLEMEEIKREIAVLTLHILEKDVQPPSPFYGSFSFILFIKATQLENKSDKNKIFCENYFYGLLFMISGILCCFILD